MGLYPWSNSGCYVFYNGLVDILMVVPLRTINALFGTVALLLVLLSLYMSYNFFSFL